MKEISKKNKSIVFQGDIMIMRVASVPDEAKPLGSNVVAHSETGHHHVATNAQCFGLNPMVMFMKSTADHIDLEHKRPFDTHETIRLYCDPGDTFIIKRQREWTPEGWRRVED